MVSALYSERKECHLILGVIRHFPLFQDLRLILSRTDSVTSRTHVVITRGKVLLRSSHS